MCRNDDVCINQVDAQHKSTFSLSFVFRDLAGQCREGSPSWKMLIPFNNPFDSKQQVEAKGNADETFCEESGELFEMQLFEANI